MTKIDEIDLATSSPKAIVLDAVHSMNDDVSWTKLKDEIAILEALQEGLQDLDAGRSMSQEDVERMVKSWSTK